MFKISIPKPCFEGWENMTPNGLGRHCNACAKTVVDFSVMNDEAVQQYFISNYGNNICGRFKNTQLQRIVIELPQNIFRISLPFWKKFLVAFLICFGGSFLAIDTTMAGTMFTQGDTISTYKKINEAKIDKKKPGYHKKKRRRHKLSATVFLPGDIDWRNVSTMGYTQGEIPPIYPFDSTVYPALKQNTDTGTSVKNRPNSAESKKDPKPKLPEPATAFILPTALALRNPFSKKKKA